MLGKLVKRLHRIFEGLIGVRIVDVGRLDDTVHLVLGLPKTRNALAHGLGNLRKLLGPEDEETKQEDYKELETADAEQGKAPLPLGPAAKHG